MAGADVTVTGQQDLQRVSAALKAAGNGQLRRELLRGIRTTVRPLIPQIEASALATLPRRGGLAQLIADSQFTVRTRLSGTTSVRLTARNPHEIAAMDRGRLRHPVFLRAEGESPRKRQPWVNQRIPAEWFSRPTEDSAPRIRTAVVAVVDETARKIARSS